MMNVPPREQGYDYTQVDGMPKTKNHVPYKLPVAQFFRSENEMGHDPVQTITDKEQRAIFKFMASDGKGGDDD